MKQRTDTQPVLTFTLRSSYGQRRFYPEGSGASALCTIAGRKCLREQDIETLTQAGFELTIFGAAEEETVR